MVQNQTSPIDCCKAAQASQWPGPFPFMIQQYYLLPARQPGLSCLSRTHRNVPLISANLWNIFLPNVTYCQDRVPQDDDDLKKNVMIATMNEQERKQFRQGIIAEKVRVQAELDRLDHEKSCLSCLVTGVGTCLGLAAYFGYLAMEEMEVKPVTRQVQQRVAFFGVASLGWVGVGAYRLYLG